MNCAVVVFKAVLEAGFQSEVESLGNIITAGVGYVC